MTTHPQTAHPTTRRGRQWWLVLVLWLGIVLISWVVLQKRSVLGGSVLETAGHVATATIMIVTARRHRAQRPALARAWHWIGTGFGVGAVTTSRYILPLVFPGLEGVMYLDPVGSGTIPDLLAYPPCWYGLYLLIQAQKVPLRTLRLARLDATFVGMACALTLWEAAYVPYLHDYGFGGLLQIVAVPMATVIVLAIAVVPIALNDRANPVGVYLVLCGVAMALTDLLVALVQLGGLMDPRVVDGFYAVAVMLPALGCSDARTWLRYQSDEGAFLDASRVKLLTISFAVIPFWLGLRSILGEMADPRMMALMSAAMIALIGHRLRLALRDADAAQEQLRGLARIDPLTHLMNRRGAQERLEGARLSTGFSVIFIDLDRFKPINDTHGHAVGDLLLAAVATRLSALARASDVVARLGGDEFALIMESADADTANGIGDRIVAALSSPFQLGELSLTIGASVGIAVFGPGADTGTALQVADEAMYRAKRAGRGQCVLVEFSI